MALASKTIPVKNNLRFRDTFTRLLLCSTSYDVCSKNNSSCHYSTVNNKDITIKRCYSILGVAVDSDQETVRQAFVKLVKRFHPDSGSPEADASKFQEIESAYRKLQDKFSHDRWKHNDCLGEYGLYYVEKNKGLNVQEQDIEHTAPQHRQYLSYGGFGIGTPSQRQRQYQKMRAETAINSISNYRVQRIQSETVCTDEQALVVKDKKESKKIKTRYGFERLVEDLIQESMARGDFDNLAGQGKPLGRQFDHHNPYVDLVTHKLNQVLIDNGFKPEWITLQKEIVDESEDVRHQLANVRSRFGPLPLKEEDSLNWEYSLLSFYDPVKKLNKKITKYNLVVPLLRRQMLQFDLRKEAEKILVEGKTRSSTEVSDSSEQKDEAKTEETKHSLISLLTPIVFIVYVYYSL